MEYIVSKNDHSLGPDYFTGYSTTNKDGKWTSQIINFDKYHLSSPIYPQIIYLKH
jgi:hypothetical protein